MVRGPPHRARLSTPGQRPPTARSLEKRKTRVTVPWFLGALREKIRTIDWGVARSDVQRFLPASEQEGLRLWSEEFFLYQAGLMEGYLPVE